MPLKIVVDDLSGAEIRAFLLAHLEDMQAKSPADSNHALDLGGLRRPDVTFWSAWDEDTLVGCGALKRLDAAHAEIKSMRTSPARRGTGLGSQLLTWILDEARGMGLTRISLETGSDEAFGAAQAVYRKFGFTECAPFADYTDDPHSTYFARQL